MAVLLLRCGMVSGAPTVVATIKPVHSLVAGAMEGVGEPVLLVRGGASPHHFSLRPSAARALRRAQLVIWVGAELESFLVKPLATLAVNARVVELAAAEGVGKLPARRGGSWQRTLPEKQSRGPHNMHVWLSPPNAKAMVRAIVAALASVDGANAAAYRANGGGLSARLDELEHELRGKLAPIAHRPYLVFHDAYPYFEAHFGLNAVGALMDNQERRPGARRIRALQVKIRALRAACVFAEPQFQPQLVGAVAEGSRARAGVLDPLGANLPAGPELYFTLMRNMAKALVSCLSP